MTVIALDCLLGMQLLADNSVDAIVTDPPYGLSFMGKKWDYDVPTVEVWREALRVLKPGGHLLAFAGTRTQHRMACRIEDAGFELRDLLAWVYGSGFPKSHNGEWGGTALKPAFEPVTMARKPLEGTVEANWQKWGVGALNIDGCRVGSDARVNAGAANAGGGSAYQMSVRGMPVATSRECVGRWPANLMHDGSAEAEAPLGSAARFFYCAKASRADRNDGCEGLTPGALNWSSGEANPGSFQSEGTDRTAANNHPTVKPTELMRYLVRLVTPPGGLVLDPFTGSGSTGRGAVLEGRRFIGFELDERYAVIARLRIDAAGNSALRSQPLDNEQPT